MKKAVFILFILLSLPLLACNLASADPTVAPAATAVPIGNNNFTPSATTGNVVFVTATPLTNATAIPTATPFQSATTAPTTVAIPPVMSGLSFATTASGTSQTNFANGTTEIFARWNYGNVPIGTTMHREWYRDGVLITSRDEPWSQNWGTTGRLTHIKLFDYAEGLDSGNYYVSISLPSYGITIDGNFTIASGPSSFANLTVSMTNDGTAMSLLPYGTDEVFIRFDFANIPAGTIMQRQWYRNDVAIAIRDEAWSANWGSNGRLTHISLYDFDSGYGLEPGNYKVIVSLTNQPSIKVESTFTIEANLGPSFSGLYFSDSPTGAPMTSFPSGTKRVYAIWDYSHIPVGAKMQRIWHRNGQEFVNRTVDWDFEIYGTIGKVEDIFIFDDISGLSDGAYNVKISLAGQSIEVTGVFTIGA